jgi:hypothetical protein
MPIKRKTKEVAKKKSTGQSKAGKTDIVNTGKTGKKLKSGGQKKSEIVVRTKTKTTGKGPAKSQGGKRGKKIEQKPPQVVLTHGEDWNLIPTMGNIHPARINESNQKEKDFKHKEEVALHQEQQRVKAALAMRKGMKRIFPRPRQS